MTFLIRDTDATPGMIASYKQTFRHQEMGSHMQQTHVTSRCVSWTIAAAYYEVHTSNEDYSFGKN